MNPADFARQRGVTLRTVERWLANGELPDARKGPDGRWSIPADALRQQPLPGTDMSPARRGVPVPTSADMSPARRDMSVPRTLAELLAVWPAYLTLEQASQVLGIPVGAILSRRDRYEVENLGGRLMMPQRVVRTIAGIR